MLFIVPGIMLLLALLNLPYGYYLLLRIIVSASSVYLSYSFYGKNKKWFFFLIGAFLFNPIVPVYLTREIWMVFDLGFAILFLTSKYDFKIKDSPENQHCKIKIVKETHKASAENQLHNSIYNFEVIKKEPIAKSLNQDVVIVVENSTVKNEAILRGNNDISNKKIEKNIYTCKDCRLMKREDCFGAFEICDDFKPLPRVSQEEIDRWPKEMMGPYSK
jgi:hypothetical protein